MRWRKNAARSAAPVEAAQPTSVAMSPAAVIRVDAAHGGGGGGGGGGGAQLTIATSATVATAAMTVRTPDDLVGEGVVRWRSTKLLGRKAAPRLRQPARREVPASM